MRTPSPRSKKEMMDFLAGHFRYYTMNSWNRSTSYARNIKIYKLGFDRETEAKCYDMLEIPEAFEDFNAVLHDFAILHDWSWQIGQNGRSGGYLVLYQGGRKDAGYKTRCDTCFRPTWHESVSPCRVEGCGGTLRILTEPLWESFTYPGRGVDDDRDYESMSHEELLDRVRLVKDFDRTCDLAVQAFLGYAKSHRVVEKEILVSRKMKVAVEA